MRGMKKFASVADYLKAVPPAQRAALKKLRQAIKAAAPKATELISYGIPGYKHHGMLVYFAAFKSHCSLFGVGAALMQEHEAECARLRGELAHVSKERAELESRLAALTEEHEAERTRLHAGLVRITEERAAEAQARLLVEQRADELGSQLLSVEEAYRVQLQGLEQAIGALVADRDSLLRRLVELEQTPAGRLQALLGKLSRGGK